MPGGGRLYSPARAFTHSPGANRPVEGGWVLSTKAQGLPSGPEAPARGAAASLYPVLAVNFVGALGFSIVLPFLVFVVTRLGGNALIYGVLGATYSFFQLLAAPLLGRWSDRVGRRRILLLSQIGSLCSWGIFLIALLLPARSLLEVDAAVLGAFTLTLPLLLLFIARALDGATGGNVSVANAYLADISDERNRIANFGKMGVVANLGYILGPAIAGSLGAVSDGQVLPVLAALAISVAAIAIIAVWLPETAPVPQRTEPEPVSVRRILGQEQKPCVRLHPPRRPATRALLAMPAVRLLLGLYFMVFLAFNLFYVSFPVHAATSLGWSLAETGAFFSATGVMMALVQGPVLSRAARAWSERGLVLFGSAVLAASFPFFAAGHTAVIYTGTALLALGNGLMWPSLLALLARAAGREVQARYRAWRAAVGPWPASSACWAAACCTPTSRRVCSCWRPD